jgi:hypothetical protein
MRWKASACCCPKSERGRRRMAEAARTVREDMFRKGMDHQHGSKILIFNFY